ncbi:MAG: sterol desaturase family protein, partial [Pseudomonadota bacterium]
MFDSLLAIKPLVLLGVFTVIFMLERLWPCVPRSVSGLEDWRRMGRNMALWGINSIASLAIIIPVSVFATAHHLWDRNILAIDPSIWLLFDILLLDFFTYWWHRFNHEIAFLWRFHRVHHHDKFLDVTSAVRFHFGEVILSAIMRAIVIMACGLPIESVLIYEIILLLSSFFQHSNMRLNRHLEKALSFVIVTPAWHWMHHHAVRADTDS